MKKLWGFGAVLALFAVGTMLGQLSQSGGAGSAVTATQSGTWTVQPGQYRQHNAVACEPFARRQHRAGNRGRGFENRRKRGDAARERNPDHGSQDRLRSLRL
jgi:hypothetical protein